VAFDVSAVCSGFLYSLWIGHASILSGQSNIALVIGADVFSRITDWTNRGCVFFGDAAGAVVLRRCPEGVGFLAFDIGADGRGWDAFTVPAGGSQSPATIDTVRERLHFHRQDGHAVFKTATEKLPATIRNCLAAANIHIDAVDWVVPHQPSIRILQDTARQLNLPFEKVLTNMDRFANTSAATIPLLLDQRVRDGTIQIGNTVLFAAMGAGWTWGSALVRWSPCFPDRDDLTA
jgi:3-oxoacyl-[acyl-carrier-protein] synthase-3